MLFEIRNLAVTVGGNEIVRGVSLKVGEGEVHALMGPNGCGKSTLANAVMGHPKYEVKGGILLNGERIERLKTDERARKGLFLAFQYPQEIQGVSVAGFIRRANVARKGGKDLDEMVKAQDEVRKKAGALGLGEEFVKRDLNVGFSGGEKKRAEVLQMMALGPKLVILDEIDSGVDIDGLKAIAKGINGSRDGKRAFIIITHYARILDYVKPDFVHVMAGGRIAKSGGPELAKELERKGYKEFEGK